MFLLTIVKKLDYFGPTVQFTIRNEGNFKTFFGGIVSILSTIIYVLVLYSFAGEFYYKENPNVMISKNYMLSDMRKEYEINNDNFLFAININKGLLKYVNLTRDDLTLKAYIYELHNISYVGKPIKKEIPLVKCRDLFNTSSILTNPIELLTSEIKDDFCTKFPENETFSLQGRLGIFPFKYLKFFIALNPTNSVCSKIDSFKKIDYQLIYQPPKIIKANFKPSNYEKPFLDSIETLISNFDIKKLTKKTYILDYHLLNEDDGYFFSNEKKISRFSSNQEIFYDAIRTPFNYDEMKDYCINKNPAYLAKQKNVLLDIDFIVNWLYYQEYFRNYKKLQDFLGNVNGVMDVLNKLFYLVIYLYSNCRLDYFLINNNINIRDDCNNNNISKSKIPKFEDIELSKLKSFRTKVSNDKSSNFFQMQAKLNQNLPSSSVIITPNPNDIEKSSRISFKNIYRNDLSQIDLNKSDFIDSKNNKDSNNKNYNDNSDSNRESNKLKFQSKSGKEENEIMQKINKLMEPKKQFFIPNLINYYLCCDSICKMGKKRLLQVKLFSFFSEKINKKLDILYYFKLIKKVKSLQYLFFRKKEQHMFFDILNMDLYSFKSRDICNEKFFLPKEKNKKETLIEYYKEFFKVIRESGDLIDEKFVEKLDQLI